MNYNVIGPDGAVYGPVDLDTLKRWATEGRVLPTTMIEEVGSGRQIAASAMPALFPAAQAPSHQMHSGYDAPVQSPVQPGPGAGRFASGDSTGPGGRPVASPTAAYSSVSAGAPIQNNLVKAVLTTICCSPPFGIVAIIYAAQVSGKQAMGDHYGAQDSATKANMWANVAIGVWVFCMLAYVLFVIFVMRSAPHPIVPTIPGQ